MRRELQTSKELFRVAEDDQVPLTTLLLKPFKNLVAHRFTHHSSLEKNEMNTLREGDLRRRTCSFCPRGIDIAKRLYTKS